MSVADSCELEIEMHAAGSIQCTRSMLSLILAWTRSSCETWWSIFRVVILMRETGDWRQLPSCSVG